MDDLKNKRVLITGGAGFIGSHLVDRLINLGAKIVVLDNLISGRIENIKHNLKKIKFIKDDIRDSFALKKALKNVDFILHQAALRSVPKSVKNPKEYHDVNVNGTLKLFLLAKKFGIKKIIFASSSSVYGDVDRFPQKEIDFPKPISPYAVTKLICENYAYIFFKLYNLKIISLRYFNVYGPRQPLDDEYSVVIPKFITCLLKKESPPIYGDGKQERDFTYIDNVVDANILALKNENIFSEVFNIANGEPHSVNNLLATLKKIIKNDIEPVYLEPRPGDVRKTHADITKAKKLLNYKPKVSFYYGLRLTVNWFKNNLR